MQSTLVVIECVRNTVGVLKAADDKVGRFNPAHVAELLLSRKYDRSRIDAVLVGILRCRAVRRLEDGMPCYVVDVGSWRNADAASLGREGVCDIVAVEVHRRDDVVFLGKRENLLMEGVGDDNLDVAALF